LGLTPRQVIVPVSSHENVEYELGRIKYDMHEFFKSMTHITVLVLNAEMFKVQ